ncbi:MAG: RNA polymerase sigma factor [Acidobacteria bacterium]|nr:RNA polymerase sigma factor [Acidobacteriota bacterium]
MASKRQPQEPNPDLFLARRAAAGHADAWAELIERYGRRIYNISFQFAGNRAEAEDLTQEIFLRLYRNLGRYRGDVPLAGWTLRLSRNLCIDHYRRTRTERRTVVVSEEILKHQASGSDPAARAERREKLRLVYGAIEEMPEPFAEILTLRDLQGLSYADICAFLDLPEGTMKSRLRRARLELIRRIDRKRQALGDSTPTRGGAYR